MGKTPLTELLGHHKNFVNQNVFGLLADRFTQKSLLDELNLSTSPWCLLKDKTQWPEVFKNVGEKVVVKRRTGGYDGRGQWIIMENNQSDIRTIYSVKLSQKNSFLLIMKCLS